MNPSFTSDLPIIIQWWAVLFLIGAAAYPLTRRFFSQWWDQGYLLSKSVGLLLISWIVWQFGSWKLLPFSQVTIMISLIIVFGISLFATFTFHRKLPVSWKKIILLELLFFLCLLFWSFVKAHEPDVRSLEKFMDYGFSRSIQQSSYFPPADMWYAGGSINYYYFGHLVQALLSTFSGIPLTYGYNLMLASLFALCFTISFSLSYQLSVVCCGLLKRKHGAIMAFGIGLLGAWLVTFSGNMQTIYAFTKGYTGDNPPAVWTVLWSPTEFFWKFPEGMNKYWYANATRFIPFTIHEFPSYSFVVSDNHGHVLNIPFALLAIASLLTLFGQTKTQEEKKKPKAIYRYGQYLLFGGLSGILFMTNALDGPIYLGFFSILLFFHPSNGAFGSWKWLREKGSILFTVLLGFLVASLPFLLSFRSFATGLAVNCPPSFLAESNIGPLLFETVDKCQKSPLWMMYLLWGFFWFAGGTFILSRFRFHQFLKLKYKGNPILGVARTFWGYIKTMTPISRFLVILFFYSVGLIFFSEFFYFKDIYPAHFRSNTMFKLGYQAFMMCSLLIATVTASIVFEKRKKVTKRLFVMLLLPQLFLVSIFPFFSIRSYFGNLQTYHGLYGLSWFQRDYPDDYLAVEWLNASVHKESSARNWLQLLSRTDTHVQSNVLTSHINSIPVILEADGDSYTDFDRISAFTGFPTVIGWGVHEWLWRGAYDVVAPRKDEVRLLYETGTTEQMQQLIRKYNIRYVIIGKKEREKFQGLVNARFDSLGYVVFHTGQTFIYLLDK